MSDKATKIEIVLLEHIERSITEYENAPEDSGNTKLMYQWFAFGVITSTFLATDITGADYLAYCNRIGIGDATSV